MFHSHKATKGKNMALGEIAFIFCAAITSALLSEGVSWLLIYRTADYKQLKDSLDKTSKKLEKKKEAPSKSGKSKKIDRMEESVKQQNQQLSMVKFKSLFAVTFTMILFVGLLNSWFDGVVVARLPFVPIGLVQNLSHRNIMGNDMQDCAMIFIYILSGICVRPNIQKLFGHAPPRSAPSMFDVPESK